MSKEKLLTLRILKFKELMADELAEVKDEIKLRQTKYPLAYKTWEKLEDEVKCKKSVIDFFDSVVTKGNYDQHIEELERG